MGILQFRLSLSEPRTLSVEFEPVLLLLVLDRQRSNPLPLMVQLPHHIELHRTLSLFKRRFFAAILQFGHVQASNFGILIPILLGDLFK